MPKPIPTLTVEAWHQLVLDHDDLLILYEDEIADAERRHGALLLLGKRELDGHDFYFCLPVQRHDARGRAR